jgi:hypothetical protein
LKSPTDRGTIRRSVALPADLIDQAIGVAPPELKSNFNRLVRTALQDFITVRRKAEFAEAMARMAHDPDIAGESATITEEFADTDSDGLGDSSEEGLGEADDPAR